MTPGVAAELNHRAQLFQKFALTPIAMSVFLYAAVQSRRTK